MTTLFLMGLLSQKLILDLENGKDDAFAMQDGNLKQ
jgi:hypothetical protein